MVKDAEKLLASVVIHFYSIMPPMKLLMMGIQNANARIYAAGIRKNTEGLQTGCRKSRKVITYTSNN